MEVTDLQRKLLAAARATPANEQVPYAFETRITARLRDCRTFENPIEWAQALWRAAFPCAAIMLMLLSWSLFAPASTGPSHDFSEDLENTVLAAVNSDQSLDAHW